MYIQRHSRKKFSLELDQELELEKLERPSVTYVAGDSESIKRGRIDDDDDEKEADIEASQAQRQREQNNNNAQWMHQIMGQ